MAVNDVKKFYEAILQDSALRQEIDAISQGHKGETIDEVKALSIIEQEVLPLAARMGFFFTLQDFQQYGTEMQSSSDAGRALSDEEMQLVAGGTNMACVGFGLNVGLNGGLNGLCIGLGFTSNGFCCAIGVTQ